MPRKKAAPSTAVQPVKPSIAGLTNVSAMDANQIADILPWLKLMRAWADAVEGRGLELEAQGIDVPGWKIVEGRRSRKWTDEGTAAARLDLLKVDPNDVYPRKLISPHQAEKYVDTSQIGDLIETVPGKPTLAPDSDKRPPFNVLADKLSGFTPNPGSNYDDEND